MKTIEDRPARGRMPRSRGALTGLLLVILGAWGALIPFLGPNFDFAYGPGQSWTAARGWLEVLPGVATVVGGLLLILSKSRAGGMLGGWLAALGGAWFVVGRSFAPVLGTGSVGDPVAATDRKRAVLEVAYFSGLGVLIAFLAGAALARVAARLARDVHHVETVDRVPASQHYVADAPREEAVSTDALTTPRAQAVPATEAAPRRGGLFRRHRTPVAHQ
ncbi:hypothetical protein [Mycobacterium asiaticum]|uniref:hypothetical protein n=2 Tax=Mycobacterium asiaticum TaxID=1790 RepID=UPI000563688B|nr:hypothetical protein [Mycobacterium asiaticum]OBI90669.1 hypothetical protein A5661_02810 [Mycobacterium asiaticum]OBJ55564.1 hypothetical protein A9W94_19560 [Mycobacterium asiaticum]ORA10111.1 hypothetical protein BST16_22855 [Mycobacterium asiaticum DSM 44297]